MPALGWNGPLMRVGSCGHFSGGVNNCGPCDIAMQPTTSTMEPSRFHRALLGFESVDFERALSGAKLALDLVLVGDAANGRLQGGLSLRLWNHHHAVGIAEHDVARRDNDRAD